MIKLYQGDCLKWLNDVPSRSVSAVICDPPYGRTRCKWDHVIPLDDLWKQLKRVIKPRGAIVLFCTQPYTSVLISSNLKWFKYCWVWDKKTAKGHLVVKYRPMQQTEDIAVFGKGAIRYFPQTTPRAKPRKLREYAGVVERTEIMGGKTKEGHEHVTEVYQPKTLLRFPWSPVRTLHPTQKPLELLEYLVRTYTLEGDSVLDFAFGSGTTGVAAASLGRDFIGMESDDYYFRLGKERIEQCT